MAHDISLFDGAVWYVVFLFSTTLHEASHALAALKLGDDTAVAVDKDGVYVYEDNLLNYVRVYDHDGNYLRMLHPFPADKLKKIQGLPWLYRNDLGQGETRKLRRLAWYGYDVALPGPGFRRPQGT